MNTKQKQNWILDAILFIIFIFTFLMDITGLALHQWLGIIVGVVAAIHLLTHWKWVATMTDRFFGNTSIRARLYYLIDAVILAGFGTMILTGIVISTWLNLDLSAYVAWKMIHIGSSIFTLALVLFKLGAHWKWIASMVRTNREVIPAGQPTRAIAQLQPFQRDRREFFKVMGVVGVASAIALTKSFQSLVQASSVEASNLTTDAAVQTQVAQLVQGTQQAKPASEADNVETATTKPTASTQATATAVPTATATANQASVASAQTTSCFVRCNKGCSAPGRCRRFRDTNGTGICDQNECA
jgi:hypothetical protein